MCAFYKSVCTECNDGVVGREGQRPQPAAAAAGRLIAAFDHQRPQPGRTQPRIIEIRREQCRGCRSRDSRISARFFRLLNKQSHSSEVTDFCPRLTELMTRRFMESTLYGVQIHQRCRSAELLEPSLNVY